MISALRAASARSAAVSSVCTHPGATALTRMPSGPHSFASERVSCATAPLLVEYAAAWTEPWNEVTEARCTIRPGVPRSTKMRAAARETANGAATFTMSTRSKSASDTSRAASRWMIPALQTHTSRRPSARATSATARSAASGSARSASTTWARRPRAAISATVSVAAPRWTRPTSAPSRASVTAIARPIPRLAPVTSATSPTRKGTNVSATDADYRRRPQSARRLLDDDTHKLGRRRRIARVHGAEGLDQQRCDRNVTHQLPIRRHYVPRSPLGRGLGQRLLVRSHEAVPELAVLEVAEPELPSLRRIVEPRLQSLPLLVLGDV